MPKRKPTKPSILPELLAILHRTSAEADRQEMLDLLERRPADFFRMRLCVDGVPWARVYMEKRYHQEIRVQFRIMRDRWDARPQTFDPHPPLYLDYMHASATAPLARHFGPETCSYELQIRPEAYGSLDETFNYICYEARSFFGEGTWQFIEVLTNEQAWARIKSLRGFPVEGDPWTFKKKDETK